MDNRWDFFAEMDDVPQSSSVPFQDMLNMKVAAAVPTAHSDGVPVGATDRATTATARKATTRPKQHNFSVEEDKLLVSCWLHVSLDPITGAGQRKGSFWKSVEKVYNAQKSVVHPVRSLRSLEGRWSDIKEQASKFEAHYNSVLNERHSGFNDMDKLAAAIQLYNAMEKKPITTIHCWEMLRHEPKWIELPNKGVVHEDGAAAGAPFDLTDSVPGDAASQSQNNPLKRPTGREAAKAAKRASSSRSGSESSSEYTSMLSAMHIQKMDFWKSGDEILAGQIEKVMSSQEDAAAREMLELKKKKEEREARAQEMQARRLQLEEQKEDERIMALDLSTCTEAQREMYEVMQQEILAKWRSKRQNNAA